MFVHIRILCLTIFFLYFFFCQFDIIVFFLLLILKLNQLYIRALNIVKVIFWKHRPYVDFT